MASASTALVADIAILDGNDYWSNPKRCSIMILQTTVQHLSPLI
jgi:hypothetical protein